MINRYILLITLLYAFQLCAQNNHFRINGRVDTRYNDSLVTLFTFTGDIIRSADSTYVQNGHFDFTGPEYLYEKSIISLGNYPDTVLFAEVFLEKGDILVELKQKSIVHSPLVDEYRVFQDSCGILWKQFCMLKDVDLKQDAYKQFFSYRFKFKNKYLHNALGREVFLNDVSYSDDPYFAELYEKLSDRDKSRADVKTQYEYWEKRNRYLQLKGKQFMDFTLIDSLGNEKRISDYVGKNELLFLDFWASWCGPCRAQEPHLVRLYQEYKDRGFGIMGISLDVNTASWLSVLAKKENLWPELCIAGKEDDKRIRELYSITGIPFGVLLDKSGKIISVVNAGWQHLKMILNEYYKADDKRSAK